MSSSVSSPFRYAPDLSFTRRSFLGTTAGALVTASTRHGIASAQTVERSVLYRGNPARTGVIASTGPIETPALKWQHEIGQDASVRSAPLIVGTVAYLGDPDGTLWALNIEDGSVRWSADTTMSIWSSPAYANDVVYFGNEFGIMSARSASSGDQLWNVQTGENIESSPLVIDDSVFFGSWNGILYALDAGDGSERWKMDLGDMLRASPAYADGRVYMPADSNGVYAFDAATGEVIWHFIERDVLSPPTAAVSGQLLFVASGAEGDVMAIDIESGALSWQQHLDEFIFTEPAVANGRVFIASESIETANVHALDAATGEEIWRFEPLDHVMEPPVLAGDVLYLVDATTSIYALRPDDGAELWRFSMDNMYGGELTVADGVLYAGYRNGVLALA